MLDFIVAPEGVTSASARHPVLASIPDEVAYAFFSRYFAAAQLDASDPNFLGFWGCTDVSGYQLVRLRQVMEEALLDLSARPPRFQVFVRWSSGGKKQETEIWKEVAREDLQEIAQELIHAIDEARRTQNILIAIGD